MVEQLKAMMAKQDLSAAVVAARAGLNTATVYRIMNGERSPTVDTLGKLADALGVEIADFFPKVQASLPPVEMQRAKDLARLVWEDGTHGEPASTLASYVLALLGESPFSKKPDTEPQVPDSMFWIGGTEADNDERRKA